MYYYKSFRYIDGKVRLIITDDNDNIIQYPTKEQIKVAIYENIKRYRNYGIRTCCECGDDKTNKNYDGTPHWYYCSCSKDGCTGYLCNKCKMKTYNDMPDSHRNLRKIMGKCRTNISIYSDTGKGIIIEAIIAKVRNIRIVCIEERNLDTKFDLSSDFEYGIIQAKGRRLMHDRLNGDLWGFDTHGIEICDTAFLFCMDDTWKCVERIYVIPSEYIVHVTGVTIYKSPSRGDKYEEYRMKDIKLYTDAYRDLILYFQDKKHFNLDGIKRWLLYKK